MTLSYGSLSIAQLSALIQGGSVDPVAVAEQVFEAIEGHDDKSIFISLTRERAMAEARSSSKRLKDGRSLGLLEGIPVAWKDLFDVAGSVTAAGSRLLLRDQAPATADAAVVSALASAGMVATGRVNMSEFAFSGLGINPHFGTPKNPRSTDVARIPGGSSSGSAVAVAAGLVPVSIGSDTGGSVRIPAALNGIVGYKATRGRYPMAGVFPLAASLDSLGPLCRSVQDAVWVDAAMRAATGPVVVRRPLSGLEIVVPTNVVFDDAEPGVVAAFEAAIERLSARGVVVTRIEIPAFAEILELMASHGALVTAEAYWLHQARISGPDAGLIDPRVVSRTNLGKKITLSDYLDILFARARLVEAVDRQVGGRLIAFPTVAHVAPPLEILKTDDSLFVATNGKTLRNTLLGNFLDWCGVSIPCGAGDAGMPVGFLLSGLARTDEQLLSAALVAEPIIRGETI
jgi:aspartyl-tRNA(Asn)/glutamyl-tRNA(Gln) amidotransferase subunit A